MSRTRSPQTFQLHLELKGLDLAHFVDKVTQSALSVLPPELQERFLPEARLAVEEVLREHIVAFDTCGLSSFCQDSEPYDPWPAG